MHFRKTQPTGIKEYVRTDLDAPVKNGLAITPAEMLKMADHGLAISSQSHDLFFDGDNAKDWTLGIERRRGVDMADVWEAQKASRQKIATAHNNDRQMYGD